VQHLRDFGRFEMNKRDLGRQREDRILVSEKKYLTTLKTSHEQKYSASCKSPGSFSVCEFKTPLRKFVKTEAF
jgi:hypothetical protein